MSKKLYAFGTMACGALLAALGTMKYGANAYEAVKDLLGRYPQDMQVVSFIPSTPRRYIGCSIPAGIRDVLF